MINLEHFYLFLITALVINATPGADVVFILSNFAKGGRKVAMYSALGLALGYLLYVVLTYIGVMLLISHFPLAMKLIKIIGSTYIIYLGIMMLCNHSKNKVATEPALNNFNNNRLIMNGFLVSALNPKVGLFFVAFLPQFISNSPYGNYGILILGAIFCTGATIFNLFYCYLFSLVKLAKIKLKYMNLIPGVILIILGFILLFV
jgi:threonine/homoserine/homoserine lactone efflux protein